MIEKNDKIPIGIKFPFLLIILAIGTEYFSRQLFLLLISSLFCAVWFLKQGKLSLKELGIFSTLLIIHIGVIISKLFYTPEISFVINNLFIIQLLLFSFSLILFFSKFSIPSSFLLLISFIYLPHLIGLIFNITPLRDNQFGGFQGDPNYLSPDLLFAFLSQIFIVKQNLKKHIKQLNIINLVLTFYLLLLTGSRTATISILFILLITGLIYLNKKKGLKKMSLPAIIILVILFFGNTIIQKNDRLSYIYERFTESKKGGDLVENERYYVWGISFEVINNGELFKGYGIDEFLSKQYRFVSHNVFLDAGIKYGKFTFYSHIIFVIISIFLFTKKLISKIYLFDFNIPTFMYIFSISQLIMMNSISVSQKHLYWFVLIILLSYGMFTPKYLKRNYNVKEVSFT